MFKLADLGWFEYCFCLASGHNFGMDHDMSSCHCPTDTCVMAAVSNKWDLNNFGN